MYRPKGVLTSMVTSFAPDGGIDEVGLRNNIEFQHSQGIGTVVVLGGTGEPVSLSVEERVRVMEVSIEAAERKLQVVVGALVGSPREVDRDIETAGRMGAQACMITTPPFVRPSERDVYQFFTKAAAKSKLPLIIFNVPSRAGFLMSPALVSRVAKDIDRIVAIKESTGDIVQFSEVRSSCPAEFSVLQGMDSLYLPSLALGGDGAILAAAAAFPELCLDIERGVVAGELARARKRHYQLMELVHVMYEASHPAPLKHAIEARGLPAGTTRPPLYDLTEDHLNRVQECVETLKATLSDLSRPEGH
jgi:4-hydroxy-tetrahydrodipicolinate synthase